MGEALPVLMYHAVGSSMPASVADLSVPAALLDEQLHALTEDGWTLLGLSEARQAHARGDRVVGLTFDDGFRDFVEAAVDVLHARRASATLYVPSRAMGGTATWLPAPADDLQIVSAETVAQLAEAGIEIGSHGAEHVPLDVLGAGLAARHLAESRAALEQVTQRPVVSFCYPHGYHSRPLRSRVARAGYSHACAIGHRLDDGRDPYAVQRLMITPTHTPDDVRRLVVSGPPPLRPAIKRLATPAWRVTRRAALRTTGRVWT